MRARREAVACALVPLLVAAATVAACHLVAGPANAPSDADWVTCPDRVTRCHVALERCTDRPPYRCAPVHAWPAGAARDAGDGG